MYNLACGQFLLTASVASGVQSVILPEEVVSEIKHFFYTYDFS